MEFTIGKLSPIVHTIIALIPALFLSFSQTGMCLPNDFSASQSSETANPGIDRINSLHTSITQLYREILHRDPDPSGLDFYTQQIMNEGKNLDWVRDSLVSAPELEHAQSLQKFKLMVGLFLFLLITASLTLGTGLENRLIQRSSQTQKPHLMSRFSIRLSWKKFCLLCCLLFVVRALMVLSVYPPLEGPDEYQHIAYIEYILLHRIPPVYGHSAVPDHLMDELVKLPHPPHGSQQLERFGCRAYSEFFNSVPQRKSAPPVGIYQAQHPPLYYYFVSPFYSILKNNAGFISAVFGTRILNIFLAATAVYLFIQPIRRLIPNERFARLTALSATLLPGILLSNSRIANDSPAFLFSGIIFHMLASHAPNFSNLRRSFLIGVLIACGVLSKLTVLFVLPATILFLGCNMERNKTKLGIAFRHAAAVMLAYLIFAGPYHYWSYTQYGTMFPSQETFRHEGKPCPVAHLTFHNHAELWKQTLIRNSIKRNLWFSGWSFIETDRGLIILYDCLLFFSVTGFLFYKRKSAPLLPEEVMYHRSTWKLYLIFLLSAVLVLIVREYLFYALHGLTTGLPGYAMPVMPIFLILTSWSLQGYRSRIIFYTIQAMISAVLIMTEWISLFRIASPIWADSQDPVLISQRLDSLHPCWLNGSMFDWLLFVYIALLLLIVQNFFFFNRHFPGND